MKKFIKALIISFFVAILLTTLIIIHLTKPRTERRMAKIAEKELLNTITPAYIKEHNIRGPIRHDNNNYIEFQWYKILPWGDTASIYIDVFKTIQTCSWRDKYFWHRVTMNYKTNYLNGPISNLEDIIPLNYKEQKQKEAILKYFPKNVTYLDSSLFSLSPDKFNFFLTKGYFIVDNKYENYTIIKFYEPIGKVITSNNHGNDTITTLYAKFYVTDTSKIIVETVLPEYSKN